MKTKEIIDSMMDGTPIVPVPEKNLRCALERRQYFIHEASSQGESTCRFMENTFKRFLQDNQNGGLGHIYIMMHIHERRALTDDELDMLSSFIFDLFEKASAINVTWGLHANATVSEMEMYIIASNDEKKDHKRGVNRNGKGTRWNRQWIKPMATVIGAAITIYLSIHLMAYDPEWTLSNSGLLDFSLDLLKHIFYASNLYSIVLWCLGWYLLLFGFTRIYANTKNQRL